MRVLIAEDERAIAELIMMNLRRADLCSRNVWNMIPFLSWLRMTWRCSA